MDILQNANIQSADVAGHLCSSQGTECTQTRLPRELLSHADHLLCLVACLELDVPDQPGHQQVRVHIHTVCYTA